MCLWEVCTSVMNALVIGGAVVILAGMAIGIWWEGQRW